jgi:Holliday junction resolvase
VSGPTPQATEREWQKTLVAALEVYGWHVNHTFMLQTRDGRWRTGTTAKGFPDLQALRGSWQLAIEVKGYKTAVEEEQLVWLARFANLPAARAWILRPQDDWSDIQRWMRDPEHAPRRFGWSVERAAVAVERIERRRRRP